MGTAGRSGVDDLPAFAKDLCAEQLPKLAQYDRARPRARYIMILWVFCVVLLHLFTLLAIPVFIYFWIIFYRTTFMLVESHAEFAGVSFLASSLLGLSILGRLSFLPQADFRWQDAFIWFKYVLKFDGALYWIVGIASLGVVFASTVTAIHEWNVLFYWAENIISAKPLIDGALGLAVIAGVVCIIALIAAFFTGGESLVVAAFAFVIALLLLLAVPVIFLFVRLAQLIISMCTILWVAIELISPGDGSFAVGFLAVIFLLTISGSLYWGEVALSWGLIGLEPEFLKRLEFADRLSAALLGQRAHNLQQIENNWRKAVCSKHLIRFVRRWTLYSRLRLVPYYCCPICHSDRTVYVNANAIAIHLDTELKDTLSHLASSVVIVNGTKWFESEGERMPLYSFDVDEIVVRQYDEHDVERFILTYADHLASRSIVCRVEAAPLPSPNVPRILKANFGEVHVREVDLSPLEASDSRPRRRNFLWETLGLIRRRDAEKKAKIKAEERARREAEEKVRREAEEHARHEAEKAEEHARRETEKREAEERQRREVQAKIKREAEVRQRVLREVEKRKRQELLLGVSMELVFVPAGEFLMGSDKAKDGYANDNEMPQHSINLSGYLIGKYPVTNEQYQAFTRSTGYPIPSHWQKDVIPHSKENHPVTCVSWNDAIAFCRWMNDMTKRSVRLPTEAEWEKAARGTDGRIYSWGDAWDMDKVNAREGSQNDTTPVGSYSPQGDSFHGCADMNGNVWEWCQSEYRPYPYNADDGREDVQQSDRISVLRGGSWMDIQVYARTTVRNFNHARSNSFNTGFRVVVSQSLGLSTAPHLISTKVISPSLDTARKESWVTPAHSSSRISG